MSDLSTMLVVVISTAVGALGVPTTHFLAILGAAGLAGVLKAHAKVCAEPAADVMVLDLTEIGVNIAVPPRALEMNGFSVPHRAVQLVSGAAGAA